MMCHLNTWARSKVSVLKRAMTRVVNRHRFQLPYTEWVQRPGSERD
jgi:hypothetical protein